MSVRSFNLEVLHSETGWNPEALSISEALEEMLSATFEDVVILGSAPLLRNPEIEAYFIKVWANCSDIDEVVHLARTVLSNSDVFAGCTCLAGHAIA